ncbi:glycine cleavage system h protein [hydrocarbon metagenome]|uniref:Glycine cleavage system h protein n=1 Tax=hydrocarbon metagenome TaxID=938273 RepID=A0A0W8E5Q7_9ZZZZ
MSEDYIEIGNYIELTWDKFTFKVDKTCYYDTNDFWVRETEGLLVVGISDYLQTHAGDIAFIELPAEGQKVQAGDEIGTIETIKQTVAIITPVSGTISQVNSNLEEEPELINNDAYGEGWIFKLEPAEWESDQSRLMAAADYLPVMENKIKAELDQAD